MRSWAHQVPHDACHKGEVSSLSRPGIVYDLGILVLVLIPLAPPSITNFMVFNFHHFVILHPLLLMTSNDFLGLLRTLEIFMIFMICMKFH